MTELIYWFGFLGYSAVVLVIGWRGFRRTKEAAGATFWTAGRSLNSWSAGLSISASFMSISWSCVYAVQLSYWYGVGALWLVPVPWLLTMVGFYWLAPHFRKLAAFSQPEMVAARFGTRLRAYIALPLGFVFLVWGGAELFAAAKLLSPLLQAPFVVTLGLIALIVAVYSLLGGFAAVVKTDKVQFALVAAFILTIAGIAVAAVLAQSDLAAALAAIPAPPKARPGTPALSLLTPTLALVALTFVAYLPGWLVETDIWLRLQAARDVVAARRAVVIAAANSLLFLALLPLVIGLAALLLYAPVEGAAPARLEDGAAIIVVLMQDHAPLWLSAALSIGLAAAAMSTIDTCSNVLALSLSYDLLEPALAARNRRFNPQLLSRLMAALAVFLAFLYALFTESLWDIFYLSSGILTTTIFLPVVALFLPQVSARAVRLAALAGFAGTLFFYVLESRGLMAAIEPKWLAATGLGYILWGLLCSLSGFLLAGGRFTRQAS